MKTIEKAETRTTTLARYLDDKTNRMETIEKAETRTTTLARYLEDRTN